jgi:general secretion pathway protein I
MKSIYRAFTLLELMIAVAILLIAILSLLAAFINCILLNESNRNLVTATNDAQYVLEQIKSLAYSDIAAYTAPTFNNLTDELIALDRSIGSTIAEVTVDVSWTERQRNRSAQLSTRIAE